MYALNCLYKQSNNNQYVLYINGIHITELFEKLPYGFEWEFFKNFFIINVYIYIIGKLIMRLMLLSLISLINIL